MFHHRDRGLFETARAPKPMTSVLDILCVRAIHSSPCSSNSRSLHHTLPSQRTPLSQSSASTHLGPSHACPVLGSTRRTARVLSEARLGGSGTRPSLQHGSRLRLQCRYCRSPFANSQDRSSQPPETDTSLQRHNLLARWRSPADISTEQGRSSRLGFQRGSWDEGSSPVRPASPETRCMLRLLRLRGGVFGSLGRSRRS